MEAIRKAFTATEEEFLQLVKRSWRSRPKIASAGSCCLVGAISDNVLYVANLGDSRAVLGRRGADGGAVVAERLSRDHNVSEEEVRKELAKLHPDDSRIVTYNRGAWRIKGIIQVTNTHRPLSLPFHRSPALGLTGAVLSGVEIHRRRVPEEAGTLRRLSVSEACRSGPLDAARGDGGAFDQDTRPQAE